MNERPLIAYHFALLRVVPHVHLGAFINVGVVLHARTAEFLGLRALTDTHELARLAPDLDTELLGRYLRGCEAICRGDAAGGPIAMLPLSERFHWLCAPRSDVLQTSPVHMGLTEDPQRALDELFEQLVRIDAARDDA